MPRNTYVRVVSGVAVQFVAVARAPHDLPPSIELVEHPLRNQRFVRGLGGPDPLDRWSARTSPVPASATQRRHRPRSSAPWSSCTSAPWRGRGPPLGCAGAVGGRVLHLARTEHPVRALGRRGPRRPDRRDRTPPDLVMGILLGQSGSTPSARSPSAPVSTGPPLSKVPATRARSTLGKNFITKYGTKQGIIVLGRVVPFGIGAVIGGGANATVAALAVRAAQRAFGPAPQSWPETGPEPTPESPHETPPEVVPGIVLEPEPESNPGSRP